MWFDAKYVPNLKAVFAKDNDPDEVFPVNPESTPNPDRETAKLFRSSTSQEAFRFQLQQTCLKHSWRYYLIPGSEFFISYKPVFRKRMTLTIWIP